VFLVLTLQHKSPEDAWSAFNGVVYNITPYLRFHPGGEDELMRVAGRDGTKLFSEWNRSQAASTPSPAVLSRRSRPVLTHSWVNLEHLLAECAVGMLVRG
jgi:cytochrome b involved in lipid metabolism